MNQLNADELFQIIGEQTYTIRKQTYELLSLSWDRSKFSRERIKRGYVVAKNLPPAWRKGFFVAVDVLLLYCIQHNLQAGAGFNIAF